MSAFNSVSNAYSFCVGVETTSATPLVDFCLLQTCAALLQPISPVSRPRIAGLMRSHGGGNDISRIDDEGRCDGTKCTSFADSISAK